MMKYKIMIWFLCLTMFFSVVCPAFTVARADEESISQNPYWVDVVNYMGTELNGSNYSYTVSLGNCVGVDDLVNYPYFAIRKYVNYGKTDVWVYFFEEDVAEIYWDYSGNYFYFRNESGQNLTFTYIKLNFYGSSNNSVVYNSSAPATGSSIYRQSDYANIVYYNFSNPAVNGSFVSQYVSCFDYSLVVEHLHEWSDTWSTDSDYHWHTCLNSDGLCDVTSAADMDSYGSHVFDDDSDTDCNTCAYVRTLTPVVPSVSPTVSPTPTLTPTPTPTPTPRPTATPTPTPPPYLTGGYDEDGNWVGYTEFESTSLNYLQDMKILLDDILWYMKNLVALSLILVCFETLKIVRSWVKGVGLK